MAAYSSNYQFAQPPATPQQYGQQQQQQYGMQFSPPPQGQGQGQGNQFDPHGSTATAPGRSAPRRSLSMSSAAAMKQQMALVSFDPYASTQTAPPASSPGYNNYSLDTPTSAASTAGYNYNYNNNNNYGPPPSYGNEEMTTSPHSQFGFAQQQQQFDPTASAVSDISMFSNSPFAPSASTTGTAMVPAAGTDMVQGQNGEEDFSEGSVDPAVIAEQERIWQDIQVSTVGKRNYCFLLFFAIY